MSIPENHIGELTPGSVGRRWVPEGGIQKHRDRIHRESKFADDHKKLPFSFSKPKKQKKGALVACDDCGHVVYGNVNTVGVICPNCNKFCSVHAV